jgi:hypothetical protein
VASGDGEQEMITEFFPQIQNSLSISGRVSVWDSPIAFTSAEPQT